MRFIVPINRNSEIRLRRVKYLRCEIRFACEIRPLGELWKETLRVSIQLKFKMDRTEGSAPQLARRANFTLACEYFTCASAHISRAKRISLGFSAPAINPNLKPTQTKRSLPTVTPISSFFPLGMCDRLTPPSPPPRSWPPPRCPRRRTAWQCGCRSWPCACCSRCGRNTP